MASNLLIPQLGLGTFGRTGEAGVAALLKAIEIGYRHIDTAQTYDTEWSVGEAVRRSGLPRSDFFITTKVGDLRLDKAQFMPSVEQSLKTLGVDQVDVLLIHWPSQHDAVPFEDYMLGLRQAHAMLSSPRFAVEPISRIAFGVGFGEHRGEAGVPAHTLPF